MKQLDPRAIWLFFIQSIIGLIITFFSIIIAFIVLPVEKIVEAFEPPSFVLFLVSNWWILILLLGIVNLIWVWFYYRFYRYELTDIGFKKELGVINKRYVTIPYDRIQNVDIHRNILARILGLSDIQIQTAGMSATDSRNAFSGAGSEGQLPGISREEAEVLRDELIKRAHTKKDQGL